MNNIISDHARQDIDSFLPLIAGWEPAYGDATLSFLACATVKNSCFSGAISFFRLEADFCRPFRQSPAQCADAHSD